MRPRHRPKTLLLALAMWTAALTPPVGAVEGLARASVAPLAMTMSLDAVDTRPPMPVARPHRRRSAVPVRLLLAMAEMDTPAELPLMDAADTPILQPDEDVAQPDMEPLPQRSPLLLTAPCALLPRLTAPLVDAAWTEGPVLFDHAPPAPAEPATSVAAATTSPAASEPLGAETAAPNAPLAEQPAAPAPPAGTAAEPSAPASSSPLAVSGVAPSQPVRVSSVGLSELPSLLQIATALPLRLAPIGAVPASMPEATPLPPAPPVVATTLPDAIGLGLSNNLDVRAAQFRAESFAQTRNAARGALLPRGELRLGVGAGRLESVDPAELHRRVDKSATLTQALLDEPSRREWKRQGILADAALTQLDGTRSTSALEVGTAYLQVLQARIAIELNGEYEAALNELLRYITERAAGGGASNADRDRVRSRVANTRSTLSDAKATFVTALRNLERLLGEAPSALLLANPAGLAVPTDIDAAKQTALLRNYDVLSARADVAAADMERAGNASRFLPRFDVELSQNRNTNAAGLPSYYRDTKLMVVMTVPLLNGGSDVAQYRAAAARREQQAAVALNTERRLLQDLEAAYANLDAVVERNRAVREELASNRAVVEAFKEQLTGANRSLLDVLDAYQRLHQSKLDLTTLVIGESQTQLRVAHLTGQLLPTLLSLAADSH